MSGGNKAYVVISPGVEIEVIRARENDPNLDVNFITG